MCETSCRIRRSNDGSRKSCQEAQGAGSSRSSGTLLDQDRTPAPLSEISGFRIRDLRSPNFEIKNCYLWYTSPGLRPPSPVGRGISNRIQSRCILINKFLPYRDKTSPNRFRRQTELGEHP